MKDIIEWTCLGDYGKVKRAAEERRIWMLIVIDLRYRYEDDK